MSSRPGIMLYFDDTEAVKQFLNDEQFGIVIRALIDNARHGTEPSFDGPLCGMAYNILKQKADRDGQKYDERVRKQSEAGKKGAQQRWGNGQAPPPPDSDSEDGEDDKDDGSPIRNNGVATVSHDEMANSNYNPNQNHNPNRNGNPSSSRNPNKNSKENGKPTSTRNPNQDPISPHASSPYTGAAIPRMAEVEQFAAENGLQIDGHRFLRDMFKNQFMYPDGSPMSDWREAVLKFGNHSVGQ